jgi:molybdenum cofactor cytidylyltransferase
MNDIWAIILAAGESKRMGRPKMLLPFNGSTMIETVLENVSGSNVDKIAVVLGDEKDAIASVIGKFKIKSCYNENFKEGMLSSVNCAFKNLPSDYRAAMVFQGDQPFIRKEVIDTIIESYLSSEYGIVIPVYDGRRGHPILIDRKYDNEIKKLNPEIGLRELTLRFHEDVLEVKTEEPGILRDFDTYKEYLEHTNQIQSYGRDN